MYSQRTHLQDLCDRLASSLVLTWTLPQTCPSCCSCCCETRSLKYAVHCSSSYSTLRGRVYSGLSAQCATLNPKYMTHSFDGSERQAAFIGALAYTVLLSALLLSCSLGLCSLLLALCSLLSALLLTWSLALCSLLSALLLSCSLGLCSLLLALCSLLSASCAMLHACTLHHLPTSDPSLCVDNALTVGSLLVLLSSGSTGDGKFTLQAGSDLFGCGC